MARRYEDIVDIDGLRPDDRPPPTAGRGARGERPWLAMHWRCCHVYSRIYRRPDQPCYAGRCPRCGRPVRIAVGPGGVSGRFFEAM